jgi:anaerobic selenocysteine-containing dehydrogenase
MSPTVDAAQNANNHERTIYRACNLCEAICGLEIKVSGSQIISIRGDDADPFSRGHICPKAVALKDIHEDPDRLRRPVKRVGSGDAATWNEISWDEALDLVADQLAAIATTHGNDAVALYAGNPNVHNFGHLVNFPPIAKLLKSKNIFSASSVDQMPQQLVSYLMFGHQFLIPIPDIDHTDYFLILGGNPIASNGSMMTVPDVAKRLKAIQSRGGKVVVIDPRRTETAEVASEHHFIRPGTDALLLAAMLNLIVDELAVATAKVQSSQASPAINAPNTGYLLGFEEAIAALRDFTPARVADAIGIDAATIKRIALDFANAKCAVAYGRMGTTTQAFGALTQWLIYLLNIVTGNLDRVGGALCTTPAMPITGAGTRAGGFARWGSRVRGLPETNGELPVSALAEEILTPGEGQVRALFTTAGNPVLSTPNGAQLDRALSALEFMVSVDIYINETTRHANVILPPTSALNHDHYDSVFNAFAVRNTTRFNGAIWPRADDERFDWEIFSAIGSRLAAKLNRDYKQPPKVRDIVAATVSRSPFHAGLSIESIEAQPHGIDLGALTPSLMARLETPDKKIHCAPDALLRDVDRLRSHLQALLSLTPASQLSLIGRRHVRSNNSWMHNSHRLVKGKARHQLMMHPDDMAARGIADGARVEIASRVGSVQIEVMAAPEMMPGVVSIPHGFGHARAGVRMSVAREHAGESANDLTDEMLVDALSGNAVLNGVPVTVRAL